MVRTIVDLSARSFIIITAASPVNRVAQDGRLPARIADDSGSQFRWRMEGKGRGHEPGIYPLLDAMRLPCFAVATLLAAALDAAADLFADFFNEERGAAGRASLVDRAIP